MAQEGSPNLKMVTRAISELWQTEARWQSLGLLSSHQAASNLMSELKHSPPPPGASPLGAKGAMAAEIAEAGNGGCGRLKAHMPWAARAAAVETHAALVARRATYRATRHERILQAVDARKSSRMLAAGELKALGLQMRTVLGTADSNDDGDGDDDDADDDDEDEDDGGEPSSSAATDESEDDDDNDDDSFMDSSEELAELRRIYAALDTDDSDSVDEWELWKFVQRANVGGAEGDEFMTFEEMQDEMCEVDTDGNGTIEWEEFVALMFGKVRGAERLAAAMRTSFALFSLERAAARGSDSARRSSEKDSAAVASAGDDDSPTSEAGERPIDPALLPVLRRVLQQPIPSDVAAVVRILAPDGSRINLSPSGGPSMYARSGDDPIEGELFGAGEYWDGWNTFYLRQPGDGVLLGTRPKYEFAKLLAKRFRVDVSVPCECVARARSQPGLSANGANKDTDNLFLLRFEEGENLRLLGLMPRAHSIHLWRLSDGTLDRLFQEGQAEMGRGGSSLSRRLSVAGPVLPALRGSAPPGAMSCVGGSRSFAGVKYTEERMTAPLAPLYFSPKMDTSLQLQFRRLMRERRDAFLLHLKDAVPDMPLIILVVTNRSYQRDTMKRGSGIRRNSRAFRRHRGVPEAQMHLSHSIYPRLSSHTPPLRRCILVARQSSWKRPEGGGSCDASSAAGSTPSRFKEQSKRLAHHSLGPSAQPRPTLQNGVAVKAIGCTGKGRGIGSPCDCLAFLDSGCQLPDYLRRFSTRRVPASPSQTISWFDVAQGLRLCSDIRLSCAKFGGAMTC